MYNFYDSFIKFFVDICILSAEELVAFKYAKKVRRVKLLCTLSL